MARCTLDLRSRVLPAAFFIFFAAALLAASPGHALAQTVNESLTRGLVDTVGFAHTALQIDSVVAISERLEAPLLAREDRLFPKAFIGGISPHDDYLYAGQVYVHIMRRIRAKRVVLFGVAHHAWKWKVENQLIFDKFCQWRGPFGPVKVSSLREEILKDLPKGDYLISNAYQSEEHSLEALIPFLQYYNRQAEIVPILVPYMRWERMDSLATDLAEVVAKICRKHGWRLGEDVAFLISNDCCHYGDQDWGGKNFAPFGCDVPGYLRAIRREHDLIDGHLTGRTEPERLHALLYRLVDKNDVHTYKITWCGRFSVPFSVDFLHHLSEQLHLAPFSGHLLRYGTSVEFGELPVRRFGLGDTAPSNLHHWVGYVAIGYF